MATINYNGMELEEFKKCKVFDSPFEMCVWNDNDGLPTVRFVCAVIPYRHVGQVITTNGAYEHCALLPDPPKPRRATNRELARWLIEGNAQIRHSDSDMVYVGWNYKEFEDDLPCSNDVLVRKCSDTEWHEPTVDYLFGGDNDKNTQKFEIKIDPLDFHVGLKDNMAEFESLIRMENPGKKLAENIEKKLKSRFCHCCFFGHVEGELMGEPLCKECAKVLYGFDANEEHPSIKKIDPYYQLWYRRKKALPIFEAYLHSEIERFKLELKLEEAK